MSFRMRCLENAQATVKTKQEARVATATTARSATDSPSSGQCVAEVAKVAVAGGAPPLDERFRDAAFRRAVIAARNAAEIKEWRTPLVLGHMVVCGNCDAYQFGDDPASLGHCRRYDTEVAPFLPFDCREFQTAETPAAPAFLPTRGGRA